MSRYEKKNKSDSQKCIRLPLSFFSFYFFYGLSFLYILISMGLYFLQYGFQSSDEVIHILLGQYQWREDTEDICSSATGEAVLLVDELAANFLMRNIEYGTYHQTTATNFCDMAVALLQFLQLGAIPGKR